MSLAANHPIAFIPTRMPEAARAFYESTLGLAFAVDDQFAMVFHFGADRGVKLRVTRVGEFTPAAYTIFGWEVPDIVASIDGLTAKGVAFLRYGFLQQDERGIWRAPDGAAIAWFQDPDGNTLSLSQPAR